MSQAPSAKTTFRNAYRMVRVAFRGPQRRTLITDLQMVPDYSPECRRCNAGVAVVRKVAAVVGYNDQFALTLYSEAVRIAIGQAKAA